MDRRIRKIQHTKTKTNKVGVGVPPNSEGSDGDVQIRRTHEGMILFAKYNNQWHKSKLSDREDKILNEDTSYNQVIGKKGRWTIEEDGTDLIFKRDGKEKYRIGK